ncbi:MAG: phosphomannomutase/phosphoglucomutase [Candidatus Nanopelagicaceae bacterium]
MFTGEFLDSIIKAYDVRGLVDSQLTPNFAFALGGAYATFLQEEREPSTIIIGEDMRPSSPNLADAFSDGATSQGMDVIRIGLASTDMLYFAAGKLNMPGAMFTASHNPAAYNGMKLCKSGAVPIGQDSGLRRIKQLITQGMPITNRPVGKEIKRDLLEEYVDFLLSLFPEINDAKRPQRRLKVVIDAGNGMAGHTAPAVMERLNVEVVPMYFELDGNFPNHEANPIDAKNLIDLQKRVLKEKADIGLAFDGDADRCFLIDEKGALVNPSALTGLIAVRELRRKPGSTIIYNLISSKAVPEIILENGGTPLRSRVGHSFIKKMMADSDAIFGGEHSGHFYFADFWRADSGMLAALFALTELASGKSTLSTLLKPFNRYVSSGEINSEVNDVPAAIDAILAEYGDAEKGGKGFEVDDLDGITLTGPKFWFNVRASNTEPLLRLNVEGDTEAQMIKARDALLAIIRAKR